MLRPGYKVPRGQPRKRPIFLGVALWGEQVALFQRLADETGCPYNELLVAAALAYVKEKGGLEALTADLKEYHKLYCKAGHCPMLPRHSGNC